MILDIVLKDLEGKTQEELQSLYADARTVLAEAEKAVATAEENIKADAKKLYENAKTYVAALEVKLGISSVTQR